MSGITSSSTEVTLVEQQTHEHTIKINNFKRFIITQKEFRSNHIEIFPGKKIAFVINILPEVDYKKMKFTEYVPTAPPTGGKGKRTKITENDKFLSLELLAGKYVDPPRLAGKVEIILGDAYQSFTFGDPQKGEYLKFDAEDRSLLLFPGKIKFINHYYVENRFLVKLSDAGKKDTLEIKFTLFYQGEITQVQERSLSDFLKSSKYLSAQNMEIMKDVSTTDLKITCGKKEKKKIFKVDKSFFCASSPVFRATVESDMLEGRTKEIYIEEVDEKTVEEMIHFVYYGDFTGSDLNVQMVAWVADKYDLPGMMDLLCCRMKDDEVVQPEIIADMLVAAGKHEYISSLSIG